MIEKPVEGVQTDARPHPAGGKGAHLSLKEVAERAWKGRMSPRLRAWSTQVLDKASVSTGNRRQWGKAILDAVRKHAPYIADPVMGEFMETPDQMLCLDEGGLCFIGTDCFPEGTLLLRDDFAFVPIEEIKIGERIWGKDQWSTVTQKQEKGKLAVDAIEMSNGSTMYLTGDHKVYVGQCKHGGRCEQVQCAPAYKRTKAFERIRVSDLREGDTLLQPERISFGAINVDSGRVYVEALALKMLTPEQHGGAGKHPLWRVGQRPERGTPLCVRSIERGVRKVPCWDIETDDHYVYLPEHDVTVSNCDGFAVTLSAAMMSLGVPAMIIGSSHRAPVDVPTHVYMAFEDNPGNWVRMDGTTKLPVGKAPPHLREFWIEPGAEAKAKGEGDFVGMSGAHGLGKPTEPWVNWRYPGIR